MKARSQKIIVTNEARVLRALRLEHGLSMKKAGELAGVSDSLIAHTETGRLNPPKGPNLERLLRVYGESRRRAFMSGSEHTGRSRRRRRADGAG